MKVYKWGILGTGKISNRFAQALKNISGEAELFAVGSRTITQAKIFAEEYGAQKAYGTYESLVSDPEIDIVYIGTPGSRHKEDVLMALYAGKHVLCEKAFALSSEEAKEMVSTAKSLNLFLMEAMWTRFFPLHVKIRELIASHTIGEVTGLVANFCAIAPGSEERTNRFWELQLGASTLLDIGSYGISFASSIFGTPIEITGVAHIGKGKFDHHNSCSLLYQGGKIATVISSQVSYDYKCAYIYGTEGIIEITAPWYKPERMTITRKSEVQPFYFSLGNFNGYEYEIREVQHCITSGKQESNILPLHESVQIMETMDKLRKQWGVIFPSEQNT